MSTVENSDNPTNEHNEEADSNILLSSAYMWRGFSADLELTTHSLFHQQNIHMVAIGLNHSLFVTDAGTVFARGSNEFGQLGQGSLDLKVTDIPIQVKGVNEAAVSISCGSYHCAVVNRDGQVMCWGSSQEGQCGVGSLDLVLSPTLVEVQVNTGFCQHGVPNPSTEVILKAVSCGKSHTLALSQDSEIWSWGIGSQLAQEELRHAPIPRRIEAFKGKTVIGICCGDSHSLALVLSRSQSSPSSSPSINKNLVPASPAEITVDSHYPSRCAVCNNEIYTYTESNDTCVIDELHECKSDEGKKEQDQLDDTIIEDVAGSNLNAVENRDGQIPVTESDILEGSVVQDVDLISPKTELYEQCDTSDEVVDPNSICNGRRKSDTDSNTVEESEDVVDGVENKTAEVSSQCDHEGAQMSQMTSKVAQDEVGGRATATGIMRSSSNASHKSLNLVIDTKAMEYLNRQFEDDTGEDKGSMTSENTRGPTLKDSAVPGQTHKRHSLSFDNVLGYPTNMITHVKSMTSRAWSNLGTLSPFTSSGQLAEIAQDGSRNRDVLDGSVISKSDELSHAVFDSGGNSSLESSVYRISPEPGLSASSTSESLSQEISSVNPDDAGSTEFIRQKSLRTLEMQQRNALVSRTSVGSCPGESFCAEPRPPVITSTEVWAWGVNTHCQLGLGDQVDRDKPTEIKALRGRHVIKLAAGSNHSLALTANSQVFSWGSNGYGQLGQLEDSYSPMRVKTSKVCTAWDIAAGSNHSVLLGDSADMTPEVFFCGRQPTEGTYASGRKTSQFVPINQVNKVGWITSIAAGGDECACLAPNPPLAESQIVFELLASERKFYSQLIRTTNVILRPFQKTSVYTSTDVVPFKSALEKLIQAFQNLTKKVGAGITDLTQCIQSNTPITHSHFLDQHEGFLQSFKSYSNTFSDLLAVGGFDFWKTGEIELLGQKHGSPVKESKKDRDKSETKDLLRVTQYPFYRVPQYSTLLAKLSGALTTQSETAFVHEVSLKWDCLTCNLKAEHKTAEATRGFWESSFSKLLVEKLRIPSRRLLLESKSCPVQWPDGGRFAQKIFVLFNDIFVLSQGQVLNVMPLELVWIECPTSPNENSNAFTVITPEETYELIAYTPEFKSKWLSAFKTAINHTLTNNRKSTTGFQGDGDCVAPPLVRHASHKFKHADSAFKSALYQGAWLSGKMEGMGIVNFDDGSVYEGHFKQGLMNGSGTYIIVRPGEREVQMGNWKDGKLNGLASVSYSNGDEYTGYFKNGQRFGHGTYKSGCHNRTLCTSTYVGEWHLNMKNGYGVLDDVNKGEKYMGMWVDDLRHGKGVLVTLDGMYFEGSFVQNKFQGSGLMISDDDTVYEGDFMGTTHLSGKGTLILPSGDKMEGTFSGSLNTGLKVTGTFHKCHSSPDSDRHNKHKPVNKSSQFGRLCVTADKKWTDIFSHAISSLTQGQEIKGQNPANLTTKAWEVVAIAVSSGRKSLNDDKKLSATKLKAQQILLDGLEKIPAHDVEKLYREAVEDIAAYLAKAFDAIQHPLGQLMESVVEVFRASYVGIGAHPRLVTHAVAEIRSYVRRIYSCVRMLFPALPSNGGPMYVHPLDKMQRNTDVEAEGTSPTRDTSKFDTDLDDLDDPNVLILTAAGLIYPILLPKIYPPLFELYALFNERADDLYWERVTKLNRQSDMGLMAYLGLEQRFWLMEDVIKADPTQKLSTIKDVCYAEAVDMLQQLSTAFSPIDKLKVIEQTFNEITTTVSERVSSEVMWCMDDLFPIFQFVVVRAKLQHLGAEIHLVEDLMEPYMECGEFGIMLTTLKACYFQIQNEKMPHH